MQHRNPGTESSRVEIIENPSESFEALLASIFDVRIWQLASYPGIPNGQALIFV